MAKDNLARRAEALHRAKREVLRAFSSRNEDATLKKLFGFFAMAGAEVNDGLRALMQTAYRQEDLRLFGKVMDDCIAEHTRNDGKKFKLSVAYPG